MVIAILLLLAQAPQTAPDPRRNPRRGAVTVGVAVSAGSRAGRGVLGVPIYPNAVFLTSYDAGRGQRYYLYGATGSYVELVAYYRTLLKNKGTQVFDQPLTHIFEVGRYNENDDGVSAERDDQGLRGGGPAAVAATSTRSRARSPSGSRPSCRLSRRRAEPQSQPSAICHLPSARSAASAITCRTPVRRSCRESPFSARSWSGRRSSCTAPRPGALMFTGCRTATSQSTTDSKTS